MYTSNIINLCVFVWDYLDQDQWYRITRVGSWYNNGTNECSPMHSAFSGSFDTLWSERCYIIYPDLDHLKISFPWYIPIIFDFKIIVDKYVFPRCSSCNLIISFLLYASGQVKWINFRLLEYSLFHSSLPWVWVCLHARAFLLNYCMLVELDSESPTRTPLINRWIEIM